jgi:hypothetical protein
MPSERANGLRRSNDPPPRQGPELRVIRLKGNEVKEVVILSRKLWGVFIHFDERLRRSEPCLENTETCPGCVAKRPSKWRGYFHVTEPGSRPFILELTPEAAREFQDSMGPVKSYRGARAVFRRTKADNGRLLVELREYHGDVNALPTEIDPETVLRWLWDWKRVR